MLSPRLKWFQNDTYIFAEKPQGIPTHSPDHNKVGFVELLQEQLQKPLYTFQRLDKETSGAILFALTKDFASQMTEGLQQQKIHKTYFLITDKKSCSDEFKVESHIEKIKNQFANIENQAPNSHTFLKKIKSYQNYSLWQAEPQTGKPHQIRLHAQKAGIPILGDSEHGGTPYPTLCLHSQKILNHESELPDYFVNLDLLINIDLVKILSCAQKRLMSLQFKPEEAFRVVHTDHPFLRIDKLGPTLWVYSYKETELTSLEVEACAYLAKKMHCSSLLIRTMLDRGAQPNSSHLTEVSPTPEKWRVEENSVQYEMRKSQGLSPGLFLDQRHNRHWVYENAKNKKVLNLFAYTGGFSVCAALGGATQVTTVDVSKNFIEWSQYNFRLNQLDPDKHEFWSADSFVYLKGAIKHQKKFDLIILDPPSFSRSPKGVFKIEKDLAELLKMAASLLSPQGQLLVSCNYEKWDLSEFKAYVHSALKQVPTREQKLPLSPLDFFEYEPLMKALLLQLK